MKELLQEAKALQEQIVADRRYLHQIPEVGMDLPESAAYIEKRLREMGIEPHHCGVMDEAVRQKYIKMGFPDMKASTGVVATIGSAPPASCCGPTLTPCPWRRPMACPSAPSVPAATCAATTPTPPCCWGLPSC